MNRTRRIWTTEEEEVLREQVSKWPNNLQEAFRQTAKILGRKPEGVCSHWYLKRHTWNVCFMTVSSKKCGMNAKSNKGFVKTKKPWWEKLLALFGLK